MNFPKNAEAEEKRLKLEEKRKNQAEVNRLKNIEKLRKCHLREQKKLINPKECIKYIKISIEPKWIEHSYGKNINSSLNEQKLKYEIRNKFGFGIISWERDIQQLITSENDLIQLTDKIINEKIILFMMTGEELVNFVKQDTLITQYENVKSYYPDKLISLIVFGFKQYIKQHRIIPEIQEKIKIDLCELQISYNCNHRFLESCEEVSTTIIQYTKAIAEAPFKKAENEKYENFNFYIKNDNKDCVQVEDDIGLKNLWQHHLTKMPLTTIDKAQSIIQEYPMPNNLIQAYKDNPDGENLLADIPVRRQASYTKGRERLGPELSRKIHLFYTSRNPDDALT